MHQDLKELLEAHAYGGMPTNPKTMQKLVKKTIDTQTYGGLTAEIIQTMRLNVAYDLEGSPTTGNINTLNVNPPSKFIVKLNLNEGGVYLEPGALHYMNGKLELSTTSFSSGGGLKGMFQRAASGESASLTRVKGTGEIFLEPKHGTYFFMVVMDNTKVVADAGTFYACSDGIEVGAEVLGLSAAVMGGEGMVQTKLTGSGLAIFESKVPEHEIVCVELNNEKLYIDGSFSILRMGDIKFKVEKSAKSFLGSAKSGEGFMNVFEGTGHVWLMPSLYY